MECIKYNLLFVTTYLLITANFHFENNRVLLWWVSVVTTLKTRYKSHFKILWPINGKKTIYVSKPSMKVFRNKIRQLKPRPKVEKIWLLPKAWIIVSWPSFTMLLLWRISLKEYANSFSTLSKISMLHHRLYYKLDDSPSKTLVILMFTRR